MQKTKYNRSTLNDVDDSSVLYAQDWNFYAKKLRQENYSLGAAKTREYFEVEPTFKALLEIFHTLFGIEFVRIESGVWHGSVITYVVWDSSEEGGEFLGYLYVDLVDRDGKNRSKLLCIYSSGGCQLQTGLV